MFLDRSCGTLEVAAVVVVVVVVGLKAIHNDVLDITQKVKSG